jgi:hypothetical protein
MATPDICLRLDQLDAFFVAPAFDWRRPPHTIQSGVKLALAQLEGHPEATSPRIRLTMDKLPSAEEESQFRAAFTSFCTQQAEARTWLAKDIRKQGWRALRLGLLALAFSLGLSTAISQLAPFPHLLNELLSEGFIIVGWVVLWHPLEMLLYEGSVHRRMARLYTRLGQGELTFTTVGAP